MRIFWSLFRQHLRHQRFTTLIWLALIGMMAYSVASVAKSVVAGNNLENILNSLGGLKNLFGDPNAYKHPADLYIQAKWLFFMPLLMGIFGVLSSMGILAREIDRRTADFILTLPVRRSAVLLSRFAALTVNLGLLYFGSFAMIWLGLRQTHIAGSFSGYALYSLGQYVLTLFFAALTLYLSLYVNEYPVANRYALIGVVAFYTLNLIARSVGAPRIASELTVFGLADAQSVIGGGSFPWLAVAIGGLLTIICLWASTRLFEQKQVPA